MELTVSNVGGVKGRFSSDQNVKFGTSDFSVFLAFISKPNSLIFKLLACVCVCARTKKEHSNGRSDSVPASHLLIAQPLSPRVEGNCLPQLPVPTGHVSPSCDRALCASGEQRCREPAPMYNSAATWGSWHSLEECVTCASQSPPTEASQDS